MRTRVWNLESCTAHRGVSRTETRDGPPASSPADTTFWSAAMLVSGSGSRPATRARRAGRPSRRGLVRGVFARRQGPGNRQRRHRRTPDNPAVGTVLGEATGRLEGAFVHGLGPGLQPGRTNRWPRRASIQGTGVGQRQALGCLDASASGGFAGPCRQGSICRLQPGWSTTGDRR